MIPYWILQHYQGPTRKGYIIERFDEKSKEGERKHHISHMWYSHQQRILPKFAYCTMLPQKRRNKSPNKCLYRVPVIIENLFRLLMRFRMKRIGINADIEKAFSQESLQPKERDVTRLLWLKYMQQPVLPINLVIWFTRVPFGIISPPTLLSATIKHYLTPKDNQPDYHLSEDLYVNNLTTRMQRSHSLIYQWTYGTGIPTHPNYTKKSLNKIACCLIHLDVLHQLQWRWDFFFTYTNYNQDETSSSKLVDLGKRMGWSVGKRGD